jgi:hypothetical protein
VTPQGISISFEALLKELRAIGLALLQANRGSPQITVETIGFLAPGVALADGSMRSAARWVPRRSSGQILYGSARAGSIPDARRAGSHPARGLVRGNSVSDV